MSEHSLSALVATSTSTLQVKMLVALLLRSESEGMERPLLVRIDLGTDLCQSLARPSCCERGEEIGHVTRSSLRLAVEGEERRRFSRFSVGGQPRRFFSTLKICARFSPSSSTFERRHSIRNIRPDFGLVDLLVRENTHRFEALFFRRWQGKQPNDSHRPTSTGGKGKGKGKGMSIEQLCACRERGSRGRAEQRRDLHFSSPPEKFVTMWREGQRGREEEDMGLPLEVSDDGEVGWGERDGDGASDHSRRHRSSTSREVTDDQVSKGNDLRGGGGGKPRRSVARCHKLFFRRFGRRLARNRRTLRAEENRSNSSPLFIEQPVILAALSIFAKWPDEPSVNHRLELEAKRVGRGASTRFVSVLSRLCPDELVSPLHSLDIL